jgi:D-alanyl-D-alanine carboxypeptidase
MRLPLVLSLIAFSAFCHAQNPADGIAQAHIDSGQVAGMSVAIAVDGDIIFQKGFGKEDIERNLPASEHTVYEIGSLTKQFTAVLTMMLVEEGKIDLDGSVRTYLPQTPESWQAVTIRNLLNHTSGIKSYTSLPGVAARFTQPVTHDELLGLVKDLPLEFEPGTAFSYNNTAYYLLGMIIEKADGKSYRESLRNRVLRPLNLRRTDVSENDEAVARRATGFNFKEGSLVNVAQVERNWAYSAGAMLSTASEIARWFSAFGDIRLLQPASWELIQAPTKLKNGQSVDYGFGFAIERLPGSRVLGHGGGIPGFASYANLYRDRNLVVVVLSNTDSAPVDRIVAEIAGALDESLAKPAPTAVEDDDPVQTEAHRKLFFEIADGTFDRSLFTEDLVARLEGFAEIFRAPRAQLGEFRKIGVLETSPRQRVYRLDFANGSARVLFRKNADGKIDGFAATPLG